MDLLLGIASLTGVSLVVARWIQRSSALGPIVAVAASILWFAGWGMANLLLVGGWLWYVGSLAAVVWLVWKEKKNIFSLFTPGLVFFVLSSVFFVVLFFTTKPLFTQWDEFTFWGTASKVVVETNQLYTVAQSNLIARSAPPALPLFSYMMQFFGGSFADYKAMAALAVLYMAAFSAASALWGKNRTGAAVFLAAFFFLPFFFETSTPAGQLSWSYLSVMADASLAAFFGGALALYFAGGQKSGRLLLPFALVLAALTSIKDIGLALALIALFVVALDMLFCERDRLAFWRFRALRAWLAACAAGFVSVAGAYGLWALHLKVAPTGINRFDVGNSEQSVGMVSMMLNGIKAMFGIQPDDKFNDMASLMSKALFQRDISLLGASVWVFAFITILTVVTWLLSGTSRQRRRVAISYGAMLFCFAAFYMFNVFTYTFILKDVESYILKDYHRYIYPYWQAWLMVCLVLLSRATQDEKALRFRLRAARAASVVCATFLVGVVLLRGNLQANFLQVSPSLFTHRWNVQNVVTQAKQQGMKNEDVVYTISQGDNSSRFYMFGFELDAKQVLLFAGKETDKNGKPLFDEEGAFKLGGNTAASFVAPGNTSSAYEFPVQATRKEWVAYLKQESCTHVLLDTVDEYIIKEFGPLFEGGLKDWELEQSVQTGNRYYKILWDDDDIRLVPADEGAGK